MTSDGHQVRQTTLDSMTGTIERLRSRIAELESALREIAAHHEEQSDLWATDGATDADIAQYHGERRDFALKQLTPPA